MGIKMRCEDGDRCLREMGCEVMGWREDGRRGGKKDISVVREGVGSGLWEGGMELCWVCTR